MFKGSSDFLVNKPNNGSAVKKISSKRMNICIRNMRSDNKQWKTYCHLNTIINMSISRISVPEKSQELKGL